jgi:hypothetical protein
MIGIAVFPSRCWSGESAGLLISVTLEPLR